jgi:hypothetical protein
LKSIEKQTLFLIFVIFGKVEKKKKFLELILVDFGAHLEIRGSQNPPFRASAIAGYLQIHLPKEIT